MSNNQKFQFRKLHRIQQCPLSCTAAVTGYQYITFFRLKQDTYTAFVVIYAGFCRVKFDLSVAHIYWG